MFFADYARRCLVRLPKRLLLYWVAMTLMVMALSVQSSIVGGFRDYLYHNATRLSLGSAQIHDKKFIADEDFYRMLTLSEIAKGIADAGFVYAPRSFGQALAATESSHQGVSITAIDPGLEFRVTSLNEHLQAGQWFDMSEQSVVVGSKVSRILGLVPGNYVDLIGRNAMGGYASGRFLVAGVLKPLSLATDRQGIYLSQTSYRDFFQRQHGVHELALRLSEDSAYTVAEGIELLRRLYPDLLVRSWKNIRPTLARILSIIDVNIWIWFFLVYFVVGIIIVNIKLMDVHSRIREFGTMKALGMFPRDVVRVVVYESFFLAVLVAFTSSLLALPIVSHLHHIGLDLSGFIKEVSFAGVNFSPRIYGRYSFHEILLPPLFVTLLLPMAGFYPALRAAGFSPLDAMRR